MAKKHPNECKWTADKRTEWKMAAEIGKSPGPPFVVVRTNAKKQEAASSGLLVSNLPLFLVSLPVIFFTIDFHPNLRCTVGLIGQKKPKMFTYCIDQKGLIDCWNSNVLFGRLRLDIDFGESNWLDTARTNRISWRLRSCSNPPNCIGVCISCVPCCKNQK